MSDDYEFCRGECCRNQWRVCLHRRECAHHLNEDYPHRTTYRDPTGNEAVNNIMREQKDRSRT